MVWLPPVAYLALALAVTWPWLVKPSTTLMGPIGGDVTSSIAKFGAIVESGVVPYVSGHIGSVGFPDGVPTTPGLDTVSGLSSLFLWGGSAAIGPVAAHGLLAVLGFFLTATVTYLFVRRVTDSVGAGLVAGVAYGFSPHLHIVVRSATTYAHMWLFVLPLWAFWNLAKAPDRRRAVIAGLSLLPAMFWTPYFALHGFAVCFACLLVVIALGPRIDFPRRLAGLVVAPWIGALVLYVGVGLLSSFSDSPDRPLSDFYDQSAHPLMFVLPGFASSWRDGMTQTLVEHVPRAAFVNLYLGLSVLVLGVIGIVGTLGSWTAGRFRDKPSPQALAALLALATIVVCAFCSLPPRVLHGSIPMPALLIHEVAPGLRAGQRFVMPLMAGTAVLAGLGTSVILRRLPRVALAPVSLAIALVVALDLWATPPGLPTKAPPRSPALAALARAPEGAVVHIMPEGFLAGTPAQNACLMQQVHHKPLVNTCGFAKPSDRLWRLAQGPMCDVLSRLKQSGLRYVLAEPLPAPPNVIACFRARSRVGPWRMLARDRYMAVYELLPAPS